MEGNQLIENANSMALDVNKSLQDKDNLESLKNQINFKENDIACDQAVIQEVAQSTNMQQSRLVKRFHQGNMTH